MRVTDILFESKTTIVEQHFKKTDLLVESVCKDLTKEQKHIVEGIYKEFRPLIEASLTADQINKIFTDVEAGATAGGDNRTLIGKAKDVPGKVNDIINNVGKWLQDTTPVKMADQKFEQLKAKIGAKFPELDKQLTGFGTWMKDNPGKSAAVIGVLTALASLAGGPVGGAIAGQALRGAAELIKGEKLSTAVGKGVKTAVFGFIAGKAFEMLGDWLGGLRADVVIKDQYADVSWGAKKVMSGPGWEWTKTIQGVNVKVLPDDAETINFLSDQIGQGGPNAVKAFDKLARLAEEIRSAEYKDLLKDVGAMAKNNDSLYKWIMSAKEGLQAVSQGAVAASTGSKKESVEFNHQQIKRIFECCEGADLLTEGPLDWLKQKGKNLTTKITADKLMGAWKKAGSPTDSDAVADILRQQGVDDQIIGAAFKTQKIKLGQPKQQTAEPQQAAGLDIKTIIDAVAKMRTRDLQSLAKHADQLLGVASAKQAPGAAGAFGQMAQGLAGKAPASAASSTGGTTTKVGGTTTHKANPNNPNAAQSAPAPAAPAKNINITGKKKRGGATAAKPAVSV